MILKKLNNIDVLYSLLDVNNNRLDRIAREEQFTNTLNLVLSDQMIFNRFYNDIIPRIHQNIQNLTLESSSMKYILSAGNYPNLTHLKLYEFSQDIALEYFQNDSSFVHNIIDLTLIFNNKDDFRTLLKDYTRDVYVKILCLFENLQHLNVLGSSIAAYPSLSLCDLPASIFSSSILTKLWISVSTFDDLLDGRLNQLTTLIVRIDDIDIPSLIIHNTDNLLNLKCFSLTCHNHIDTYNRVLTLLHRMFNLHELTLCLTVRNPNSLIDGTHLKNYLYLINE